MAVTALPHPPPLSLLASARVVRHRAPPRDATGLGTSEKRAGKVMGGTVSATLVAPRPISAVGGPSLALATRIARVCTTRFWSDRCEPRETHRGPYLRTPKVVGRTMRARRGDPGRPTADFSRGGPSLALATCIARVCTTRFWSDRCEPRQTHRGPYLRTPEVVGRTMRARRGGGRVKKWVLVGKWCLVWCQVAVAAPRRSRSPDPSTGVARSREGSCACALKFSRHSETNCVHTRRGHPHDPLDRLYFFLGVHPSTPPW